MSDSSSSSSSSASSTALLDRISANTPRSDTATPTAASTSSPATTPASAAPAAPTPTATATTTTAVTEPTTAIVSPLREDMIKPAVSFLSSANVRSADKAKKIAFLQQKGLNQAEIDEAFKRTGDGGSAPSSSPAPAATATNNYTQQQQQELAPVLPSRQNFNYGQAQQPQTQIIYVPQPQNPPIPVEKVFAMAVLLGMGAVGLTAGVIGLLRRFIAPIFKRIAEYKRTRYNQRKEIANKLLKSLQSTENDDLDALIDQGDEKTVVDALVKHQTELSTKLDKLVQTSKEQLLKRTGTYSDFRSELTSFRNVITNNPSDMYASYAHYNTSVNGSPVISGLKSDIRSLKAVLLNRRNFPK